MLNYTLANDKVILGEQEIPVVWRGDMLVAGGGPGGLSAAFPAHRSGLKVMLIEELGFLGGMMSLWMRGMPFGGAYPAYTPNGGFAEEIIEAVRNAGKDSADIRVMGQFSYWFFHDSEYFKSMIAKKVLDEKLPVRLHTTFCDVLMKDDHTVAGVVVESKSGRQALLADVFVDATGDADLCARAGADYEMGDENGEMMAANITFSLANVDTDKFAAYKEEDPRFFKALTQAEKDGVFVHPDDKLGNLVSVLRKGTLFCNTIRIRHVNCSNVEELTMAELESRIRILQEMEFLRKYIPGCEDCYIGSTGSRLGVRETRRIIGEDRMAVADALSYRKREADGIVRCGGPFDNVSRGKDYKYQPLNVINEHDWYHIPYGCLVPKKLDNVIVAGRTLSCDFLILSGVKGMGKIMGMGQAAGTAAVYVIKNKVPFREVDTGWLRQSLRDQGCNIDK